MTQREFIQSGLKLLGFWLFLIGSINILSNGSTGISTYLELRSDPSVSVIRIFSVSHHGGPKDTKDEMVQRVVLTGRWLSWQYPLLTAFMKTIFGLYLCKGGKIIVDFLVGPNQKEAAQHPAAPYSESRGGPPQG